MMNFILKKDFTLSVSLDGGSLVATYPYDKPVQTGNNTVLQTTFYLNIFLTRLALIAYLQINILRLENLLEKVRHGSIFRVSLFIGQCSQHWLVFDYCFSLLVAKFSKINFFQLIMRAHWSTWRACTPTTIPRCTSGTLGVPITGKVRHFSTSACHVCHEYHISWN